MSLKANKYRIYPNKTTTDKLYGILNLCRELYNAGLQERRDAYEIKVKRHPNYYDNDIRKQLIREHAISVYEQKRDLVDIKEMQPEYQEIASHVIQAVLFRLEEHTCPADKKGMVSINLCLTKIGTVKLHLHRAMAGTIKTLTIKREGEHWYAVFTCEIGKPEALPVSYEDVGIDLGVSHFGALSNGEVIDNPRHYRKAEQQLKKLQEAVSRKKRGSHRRKKAVLAEARAHRKIRHQRQDFLHKQSRRLVNRYQIIAFEDLHTTNLVKRPKPKQDEETGQYLPNGAAAKAGLNKSIVDAGWSQFVHLCTYKSILNYKAVIRS